MSTTYAQKQSLTQKKDAPSASSVFDASSQSESLQRKADMVNAATQRAETPRPNNTGMPDNLKSGIESLSGFSMDDVRVHYNSPKPATVQALAYTQGTDIHVAPGQEKHLPHEAWHVAQQMAGRVSPTTNINGMPVNDNTALEHEADVMGEKAVSQRKEFSDFINKKISCTDIAGIQRFPARQPIGYDVPGSWVSGCIILRHDPVYNGTVNSSHDDPHNERIKALQAISAEAGNLGNSTRVGETCALADNESFSAVITAKYKTSTGSPVELALTYNFMNGQVPPGQVGGPGYITMVNRTKGGKLVSATMVNGNPSPGEYSNKHEESIDSIIGDTSRKNGTSPKKAFEGKIPDAYTKLAGEGARFLCVRNNMQNLNDNTVFWFGDCGVKFSDLWKSWGWSFNKKFNITNDEICKALQVKELNAKIKDTTKVTIGKTIIAVQNMTRIDNYFVEYGNYVPRNGWTPAHYSETAKIAKGYLVIEKKSNKNGYLDSITLTEKIESKPSANLIDLGGGTVSGIGSSTIV